MIALLRGEQYIAPYVDIFVAFMQKSPVLHFLVTPVGCGIAGFREYEIAPIFQIGLGAPIRRSSVY